MMETSAAVMDEEEWPTLGGGGAPRGAAAVTEDWEMLGAGSAANTSFEREMVVVADDNNDNDNEGRTSTKEEKEPHKTATPSATTTSLPHAASVPNLSGLNTVIVSKDLDAVAEVGEEEKATDAASFAMVSGPGSVLTVASTTTGMVSFRDAILAGKANTSGGTSSTTSPAVAVEEENKETIVSPSRTRSRVQPRFVVVASPTSRIRRCSKSTGDLQSLALMAVHEDDDDEHELSSSGGGDATEFYSRKAMGENSRVNGLKLRPDEAKRRDFILQKKDDQRRRQAVAAAKGKMTVRN